MGFRLYLLLLLSFSLTLLAEDPGQKGEASAKQGSIQKDDPKKVYMKKARKVTKDVLNVLSTEFALKAVSETKKENRGNSVEKALREVGKTVEELVRHTIEKHGFEDGIVQALTYAEAAGDDKAGTLIKRDLKAIEKILSLEEVDEDKDDDDDEEAKKKAKYPEWTGERKTTYSERTPRKEDGRVGELAEKEISVKRSKKIMKELIAVLTSDSAKREIAVAREGVEATGSQNKDDIVDAAGAVIEKLVKDITEKHGFNGGLNQAFASIFGAASKKGGEVLQEDLQLIGKIVAQEKGQAPPGGGQSGGHSDPVFPMFGGEL